MSDSLAIFILGFTVGTFLQMLVLFVVSYHFRRKAPHRFDWAIGPVTNKPAQREKP